MLIFAAHVPHTPLLLPTIGRENTEALKKTREALKIVAEELYAAHPDVLIILASHGNPSPDAFAVNLNDLYETNLSEFGDIATKLTYAPEAGTVDRLQRFARRSNIPFTLFSDSSLGHGLAVPLITLTERLKKIFIIPLFSATGLPAKTHFEFGQSLNELVSLSDLRLAVVSAGDLSHALSSKAPAGLRPEGALFDEAVRQAVKSIAASGLLQLDAEFVAKAAECAYYPVLIMLGLLDSIKVRPEELAYEAPFGVGYLTVIFHL